jgi:hypothetical protein
MMALAAGTEDRVLEKAGFFKVISGKGSSGMASPTSSAVVGELVTAQSPLHQQLKHLLIREVRQAYRDKASLIGRFGVTIFLNTLVGLIFAGSGARDSAHPDGLSAHFGALVMVIRKEQDSTHILADILL